MEVKLVIVGGKHAGKEIPVKGPEFLIGRGAECRLQPGSHLVSRKHCAVVIENDVVAIKDFGSTNGTLVNGERIDQQHPLANGDRIKIGMLEMEVRIAGDATGRSKLKVSDVQKVVAPKTASRAPAHADDADDDLDISSWLEDDSDGHGPTAPAEQATIHDTAVGKPVDETIMMPVASSSKSPEKKQDEPPAKVVGQFQRATKPKAENSRSAAEDTLKKLFHK